MQQELCSQCGMISTTNKRCCCQRSGLYSLHQEHEEATLSSHEQLGDCCMSNSSNPLPCSTCQSCNHSTSTQKMSAESSQERSHIHRYDTFYLDTDIFFNKPYTDSLFITTQPSVSFYPFASDTFKSQQSSSASPFSIGSVPATVPFSNFPFAEVSPKLLNYLEPIQYTWTSTNTVCNNPFLPAHKYSFSSRYDEFGAPLEPDIPSYNTVYITHGYLRFHNTNQSLRYFVRI